MSKSVRFATVIMFGGLLGGCLAEGLDQGVDPARDEPVASDAEEIIRGKRATTYPEAVLVDMENMLCSGTIIAPKVVLTAAHCVADFNRWTVRAPYAGGQTATGTRSATFDWTQSNDMVSPDEHDVALVFLDTPIKLSSYPTLATKSLSGKASVVTVGRVNNGQVSRTDLFVSAPVAATTGDSKGFPYDYAAPLVIERGDSGGASYIPNTHVIVSVNSTATDGQQLMARVDVVNAWIRKQMASPPRGNPGGAPAAPRGGQNCVFDPWRGIFICQ